MTPDLTVIGGGLAGCEAAWQAAQSGLTVRIYEMRPGTSTGAHQTGNLAELVCSNSLGSKLEDRASGQLMWEAKRLGSLLVSCAEKSALPAGRALAVDREVFSRLVTDAVESNPHIEVIHAEITDIPDGPTVIAAGPLVSAKLAKSIAIFTGKDHLYFYDAIAPVVLFESIDMKIAFWGSRYDSDENELGDYINCPLNIEKYDAFYHALTTASRSELREFESNIERGISASERKYYEGCLPVEILALRDPKALTFGPLRPVGLTDPRTGRWPHAVVQLRRDNLAGSLFNLVGFQTNLRYREQERVFRMIPGLEHAEFVRHGQMHRNTFINSPALLLPTLQSRTRDDLFFTGQIAGIEGYMGNIASGVLAGINAARQFKRKSLFLPPSTTMLGALCRYITQEGEKNFQPMKVNFGLLQALEGEYIKDARKRAAAYVERARAAMEACLSEDL